MGLIIDLTTSRGASAAWLRPRSLDASVPTGLWGRVARGLGAALCGLLVATGARAQNIDDLELRRDGADAVVQIRFVSAVQYLRLVAAKAGDQALVFYRVLPTAQPWTPQSSERQLSPRRGSGLPVITVTDEHATGRAPDERRLLVRFASPVKYRVRPGRNERGIDLVLEGLGARVQASVPAGPGAAQVLGRFRVTLESSERTGSYLSAPIPAALQEVNVFTTQKVLDGRVIHETHLGPFATRGEAEAALRLLGGRFPQAAITEAPAPGAPPARMAEVAPAASAASAAAVPAGTPAPGTSAAAAPASAPAPSYAPVPVDPDLDQRAATLLATAREALARDDINATIDTLSRLLDLPPTASTRPAQALIGQARAKAGDPGRARAEYELFLRLYPTGEDADQVRSALAAMSPAVAPGRAGERRVPSTTTLNGSLSSFYYGGQSKVRTQEFQDSPLSGLPELVNLPTLSGTDQSQVVSNADVNWRHRDADVDQRFVLRDAYYKDFDRPEKSKNRLTALYFDQRSFTNGTSWRVGRQSPLGGGVLGRFDGVQAGYTFRPRWKANVVLGAPTDDLLASRRHFYGLSVDAEALTPQLGASLYAIEHRIDGEIDRRAVGSDIRYFEGGLSATAQLDYDVMLKALNIASLQATWQRPDNTVFNFMYDRRTTPMLMLGNTLFFAGATVPAPTRLADLLAAGASVDVLRQQVLATTAKSTQAALGVTTPIGKQWQVGGDVRFTNTGAIAPVPDLLPQGQPSTGDIWSLGLQLIGTNLYSPRDTHVFLASFVNGPLFQGQLFSYNNSSLVKQAWQLEPSFKYYRQTSTDLNGAATRSTRWAPGLRVTWRMRQQMSLESEINVENSKTTSATRNESSSRTFYYLGARYDF